MAVSDPAARVVQIALDWVGKDFHPGQSAQCAPFVRYVFEQANVDVASSVRPSDFDLLGPGDGLSPSFADSFAGNDVGRKVDLAEAKPGDIVMFNNTYGEWRDGVITHVGIYVGGSMMVDRSTSAHPVSKRSVYTFSGGPSEIRRPKALDSPKTRLALKCGSVTATVKGEKCFALDVKVQIKGNFGLWLNNTPVKAKVVNMKLKNSKSGKLYRLSMQNGSAKVSADGMPLSHFHCHLKLAGGGLNVWVDDQEIKTNEAAIEIVHQT